MPPEFATCPYAFMRVGDLPDAAHSNSSTSQYAYFPYRRQSPGMTWTPRKMPHAGNQRRS
ncbi:hypothetical protein KCP76_14410 [Salmonella enterica subsp. enterica serovar Weltevreden]|nr:hypothetical protein KCP76_14410 [Salmonella enterica subsp. enterica serovar Weltevreden]